MEISKRRFKDYFAGGSDNFLRKFQEDYVESLKRGARVIFLEAPVGSGKTACAVLSLAIDEVMNIVGLYPTKELIYDQAASIIRMLLDNAGMNVGIKPYVNELITHLEDSGKLSAHYIHDHGDVHVIVATSDILDNMDCTSHPDALSKILEETENTKRIVLMPPDILYLIQEGLYGTHKTRLERSREILRRCFSGGSIIFFDEFHSWDAQSFSNALMLASTSLCFPDTKSITFSTATPTTIQRTFLENMCQAHYIKPYFIKARNSQSGTQIKRATKLIILPLGIDIFSAQNEIDKYLLHLVKKLDPTFDSPILIVVDRIYDTLKISSMLEKNGYHVSRKTGLPKTYRGFPNVIVANYAFELGVDLPKIRKGVVYAKTATSLIQRLGRIGRGDGKDRSTIILITSKRKLAPFQNLDRTTEWANLVHAIHEAYSEGIKYYDYTYSEEAAIQHYECFYKKFGGGQLSTVESWQRFINCIKKSFETMHGIEEMQASRAWYKFQSELEGHFRKSEIEHWFKTFRASSIEVLFTCKSSFEKISALTDPIIYPLRLVWSNFEIHDLVPIYLDENVMRIDSKEMLEIQNKIITNKKILKALLRESVPRFLVCVGDLERHRPKFMVDDTRVSLSSRDGCIFNLSMDDDFFASNNKVNMLLRNIRALPAIYIKKVGDMFRYLTYVADVYEVVSLCRKKSTVGYLGLGQDVFLLRWLSRRSK